MKSISNFKFHNAEQGAQAFRLDGDGNCAQEGDSPLRTSQAQANKL